MMATFNARRVIPLPPPRGRPDASWSLAAYVDWWLAHAAVGLGPNSRETYRYMTRPVLEDIGGMAIGDVTAADIQPTITRLLAAGSKESTVGTVKAAVASAFTAAVKLGIVAVNPARGVSVPAPDAARHTLLSPDQVTALVDYLSAARPWQAIYAPVALMLLTGVRVHEAVAPRMEDLRLAGPRPSLRVEYQASYDPVRGWHRRKPKSRRGRRDIPLVPAAVAIIERRLALHSRAPVGDDWALGKSLSQPYSKTRMATALRTACRLAGVPGVTPHECRHSWATNAANSRMNLRVLAELLGDDPATAMRYVHSDPETAAVAVAAMFARRRAEVV